MIFRFCLKEEGNANQKSIRQLATKVKERTKQQVTGLPTTRMVGYIDLPATVTGSVGTATISGAVVTVVR